MTITIIGGGIIGLTTAFELTERGERAPHRRRNQRLRHRRRRHGTLPRRQPLRRRHARAHRRSAIPAGRALPAHDRQRRCLPSLMERLSRATDLPTGYDTTGTLIVAADRADAEHLQRTRTYYRDMNRPADPVTTTQARTLEPLLAPRIAGAVSIPSDHQLHPRLMMRAPRRPHPPRRHLQHRTSHQPGRGRYYLHWTRGNTARGLPATPRLRGHSASARPATHPQACGARLRNSRPVYLIPALTGSCASARPAAKTTAHYPPLTAYTSCYVTQSGLVPAVEECELLRRTSAPAPAPRMTYPSLGTEPVPTAPASSYPQAISATVFCLRSPARLVRRSPAG